MIKCPHCGKTGKALVSETRANVEAVYRRRSCGHCGKAFVTYELAPPGLKMPTDHNGSVRQAKRRTGQEVKTREIRSTGRHLQDIW